MKVHNAYIYILIMAGVSFAIRVLPTVLIQKPIKSVFIRSFLHYVPYVTLAVMTFPAIIYTTETPWIGLAAMVAGCLLAWFKNASLITVAVACCSVVLVLELVL